MAQLQVNEGLEAAYAIAKAHASVDGAFDEILMRSWFDAAWELCAEMVGLVGGGHVQETVRVDRTGKINLTRKPSGPVRLYSCGCLITVLPASAPVFNRFSEAYSIPCSPSLCCYCDLLASYDVGNTDPCAGGAGSGRFVQAVARLFAYICENRGDVEMEEDILAKSGAKAFLAPDLAYVM